MPSRTIVFPGCAASAAWTPEHQAPHFLAAVEPPAGSDSVSPVSCSRDRPAVVSGLQPAIPSGCAGPGRLPNRPALPDRSMESSGSNRCGGRGAGARARCVIRNQARKKNPGSDAWPVVSPQKATSATVMIQKIAFRTPGMAASVHSRGTSDHFQYAASVRNILPSTWTA